MRGLIGAVLVSVSSLLPAEAFAWGADGHSIVAEIAARRLTPPAQQALQGLIGNASLASMASWADDYKFTPAGEKTKPWHYVDIDVSEPAYRATDCGKEGCIVEALPAELARLGDGTLPQDQRIEALKLIVHLAGDLSQPLHCSEHDGDGGGNSVSVAFSGIGPDRHSKYSRTMKLHALWDDGLIGAHVFSWGAYVDELEAGPLLNASVPAFAPGSVEGWVNECHAAGVAVYGLMPQGWQEQAAAKKTITLLPDYQTAAQPILNQELVKGGLWLAAMLNGVLGNAP